MNIQKITAQEKPHRYQILSFGSDLVKSEYASLFRTIEALKAKDCHDPVKSWPARQALADLITRLKADIAAKKPVILSEQDGRIIGLGESMMSYILGVDYSRRGPARQVIKASYNVASIHMPWRLFGKTMREARKAMTAIKELFVERLIAGGIKVRFADGASFFYDILASSADAQKKGEALFGERDLMLDCAEALEAVDANGNGAMAREMAMQRPDTAAEWLKRMAVLCTPSAVATTGRSFQARGYFVKGMIVGNGEEGPIHLRDLLVARSIKTTRRFARVCKVDGEVYPVGPSDLDVTLGDGQAVRLDDYNIMEAVFNKADVDILPEHARQFKVVATTDIVKIKIPWPEYLQLIERLEKRWPLIGYLRCVREADKPEEYDEDGNPVDSNVRELSRQLLQQMLRVSDTNISILTRRSRHWLKRQKSFEGVMETMTGAKKDPDKRSAINRLIAAVPELVAERHINEFMRDTWIAKRERIASGKLRINGYYPFLAQDPVAFVLVTVFGWDPNKTDIGLVKDEHFSLADLDGQELDAVVNRYPANAITAKVMRNQKVAAYAKLKGVLVLSWTDDTIIRFDGDFDGDEALVVTWAWFVKLMRRQLEMAKFPLIVFDHGSKEVPAPFVDQDRKNKAIAAAVVRAQEFNKVGIYSDLAMTILALASDAYYSMRFAKAEALLEDASIAHVGAILCIDQVKGNDISQKMLDALTDLQEKYVVITNDYFPEELRTPFLRKPWNQIFHKAVCEESCMPAMQCTADRIAKSIMTVGEWTPITEVAWSEDLAELMFCDSRLSRNYIPRKAVVASKFLMELNWAAYGDGCSAIKKAITEGKPLGLTDLLEFFWSNKCSLAYKVGGKDREEREQELFKLARSVVFETFCRESRKAPDGVEMTIAEKQAIIINYALRYALELDIRNNIKDVNKGNFAMFVLRMFAPDFLANVNRHAPERMVQFVKLADDDSLDMDFDENSLTLE